MAGDDSTVLANGACEGLILAPRLMSKSAFRRLLAGWNWDLEGSASSLLSFVRQVLTLA